MDLLVTPRTPGTAVKAVTNADGTVTVSGYLVVFDDPAAPVKDLAGDYFTSGTYFGAQKGNGVDTLFHHGIPVKTELAHLADVYLPPVTTEADDTGLFASVVLDMADQYHAAVAGLAQKGALGWSSGSAPHMVKRADDGHLSRWPIIEASLTPQPCEPRTVMKSLQAPVPKASARKAVDFSDGINAVRERIQEAAREMLRDPLSSHRSWAWVVDVFPDGCILETDGAGTFRIGLDVGADGSVTFADRADWVPVEPVTSWQPVMKGLADLCDLAGASGGATAPPSAAGLAAGLDSLNALLTGQ